MVSTAEYGQRKVDRIDRRVWPMESGPWPTKSVPWTSKVNHRLSVSTMTNGKWTTYYSPWYQPPSMVNGSGL